MRNIVISYISSQKSQLNQRLVVKQNPRRATLPTVNMAGFLTPRPLGAGHHHRRRHYQNNNDNNRRRHIDNNDNNNQRRDGLGACVREKGIEGHRAGDLYDRGQQLQLSYHHHDRHDNHHYRHSHHQHH